MRAWRLEGKKTGTRGSRGGGWEGKQKKKEKVRTIGKKTGCGKKLTSTEKEGGAGRTRRGQAMK